MIWKKKNIFRQFLICSLEFYCIYEFHHCVFRCDHHFRCVNSPHGLGNCHMTNSVGHGPTSVTDTFGGGEACEDAFDIWPKKSCLYSKSFRKPLLRKAALEKIVGGYHVILCWHLSPLTITGSFLELYSPLRFWPLKILNNITKWSAVNITTGNFHSPHSPCPRKGLTINQIG